MTGQSLSRLFTRNPQLREAISDLLISIGGQACICDASKNVLAGSTGDPDRANYPIILDGETCGWVTSGPAAAQLAALVELFARQEAEKKSLGSELMAQYREVNLLYHLSERLTASPHLELIASVALSEALRLSDAKAGMILSVPEGGAELQITAFQGYPYQSATRGDLLERVIQSGKADIANDVPGEDYFPQEKGQVISLACAPLKTDHHVQALIVLVREDGISFLASTIKLLNTIALQIAPLLEILRLYKVEVENERIERELLMARQVQENLLPTDMPHIPGWAFARRWRPAREVSGDFYDIIEERNNRLGLVIGDVTDKGMPASLFMVFARTALRASLRHIDSSSGAIHAANRLICQDSFDSLFVTLFYARLSIDSGEVTYVNAGHNPPLLYRCQQNEIQLLTRTGLPLGVDLSSTYTESSVVLQPGDFILFYTDGVTEAIDPAHNEFGIERLQSVVYALRNSPIDALLSGLEDAFNQFADPSQSFDDITLMAVRRQQPG